MFSVSCATGYPRMANVLVLLTNQFPYRTETGEMFLHTEIKHLEKHFDKVLICPTDAVKKCSDGTFNGKDIVLALQKTSRKRNKVYSLAKAFGYLVGFSVHHSDDALQNEFRSLKGMGEKFFFSYFYSKAIQKYNLYVKEISNHLAEEDDVVIYSYRLFDIAYLAILLAKNLHVRSVRTVSRAHRYDLYRYTNRLNYLPMRAYLYDNLDYIAPCSESGVRYLIADGCSSQKAGCGYLGSAGTEFLPYHPKQVLRIFSLSTNKPVKRVELICKTVAIASQNADVQWVHIGADTEALASQYKAYVDRKVMTFVGEKKHPEAMDFIRTSDFDLFINLSSSEGLPQSIMEAFSFGIPCLATDVGGTSEIVNDTNGYLIHPDTQPNEIAEIIVRHSQKSKEALEQYRAAAFETWKCKFNAENNAETFARFLREM